MSPGEPSVTRANGWLHAAVLAALLLAAALRWWEPALVEFKYDEAHITGLGLDLARGGAPLLLSGGTTFGIQRGALDVYLLALPLKLAGGRVEAAVWFMGALGVLSVALTFLLGQKAGGPLVGLLAALFMAANPWLVFYDRKLWAHIQVVFSAVLLLLAWQTVVVRRGRAAFWFPVIAALQMQAHVLALVQGLSWLGAFVVAPRRWLRRETALGLAVAVALLLPYAWALWQHGGIGLKEAGAPGSSTPTAEATVAPMLALRGAAQLFGGDGLHILAGLPRGALTPWRITGESAAAGGVVGAGGASDGIAMSRGAGCAGRAPAAGLDRWAGAAVDLCAAAAATAILDRAAASAGALPRLRPRMGRRRRGEGCVAPRATGPEIAARGDHLPSLGCCRWSRSSP